MNLSRQSNPSSAPTSFNPWRIAILGLACVAMFPTAVQLARSEVCRWKLAQCYEAELRDDRERAEQHLRNALRWAPNDPVARQYRISMLIRQGRPQEALADVEQGLAVARAEYERTPNRATRARLANALNLSAYVSGLGNVNLEEALHRIDEAFERLGDTTNSAMLDTRGYILWRLGRHDEALEEIDRAVSEHQHEYLVNRRLLERQGTYIVDARSVARDLRRVDEGMAALYYHRALVNESLGKMEQAKRDFNRVTNLGFDPEVGVF